jgi:hypothetical protein
MQFEYWIAYLACATGVMFVVILILTQKTQNAQKIDITSAQSDDQPLLARLTGKNDTTSSEGQSDAVVGARKESSVDVLHKPPETHAVAYAPVPDLQFAPTPSPATAPTLYPAIDIVATAARTVNKCVYTHRVVAE